MRAGRPPRRRTDKRLSGARSRRRWHRPPHPQSALRAAHMPAAKAHCELDVAVRGSVFPVAPSADVATCLLVFFSRMGHCFMGPMPHAPWPHSVLRALRMGLLRTSKAVKLPNPRRASRARPFSSTRPASEAACSKAVRRIGQRRHGTARRRGCFLSLAPARRKACAHLVVV